MRVIAVVAVGIGWVLQHQAHADTVDYEIVFDATWSLQTHPQDFPPSPHFSGLIGGTHGPDVTFWELGGIATRGIESMAETGSKSQLTQEVTAAIGAGTAFGLISGGGIGRSPGSVRTTFSVDAEYPLVSLVSMIAPSPDWFVGVSGLNLLDGNHWHNEVVVPLIPYDAGTDSGLTYTSANADTVPREPIFVLTEPFEPDTPLGTFTFRLRTGDLDASGELDFADFDLLASEIQVGSNDSRFDLNKDDSVDAADLDYWRGRLFGTLPGDLNLDRFVDGVDFNLWNDHKGGPAGLATGDANGDGMANNEDFALIEANLFSSAFSAPANVPEPSGGVLFLIWLLAALSLFQRRR